jgi:beta-lactamase class A
VFKIAVALEFFRQAADGAIDPVVRVRVRPREGLRAPAGLALFSDDVEVTLRDLVVSMLTVSDSSATDVLLGGTSESKE